MKRIMVILAATAAILASCSKSEPESGRNNENGSANIKINLSVSNLSGGDSKALIKMDWADGDKLLIWFDENIGEKPDMVIKYNGSGWDKDESAELSGNSPAASGTMKVLYNNTLMVTANDPYTFNSSTSTLSGKIQSWIFLTEIQVVVSGINAADAGKYALACSGMYPCTGLTVEADAITAGAGKADSYVTGISNADGVAFVFATANYSANSFEFSIYDRTSGSAVTKTCIASKSIEKKVSQIKAIKISAAAFQLRDYVRVAGLKWHRQNLAISASGNKTWKRGGTSAVKVPGTSSDVINGDYFQWAAYAGYCGNAGNDDKGLLIYSSFDSSMCGDSSNGFTFKWAGAGKRYWFNNSSESEHVGIAPYYNGSEYTKYTKTATSLEDGGRNILEKTDDVASIILGGSWRMPEQEEFQAMMDATYWAWDATDKGYYVFIPGQGTSGSAGGIGTIAVTDEKTQSALFFPAVGYGSMANLGNAGSHARYWSGILSSEKARVACRLSYDGGDIDVQKASDRFRGFSVRPVSD